MQKLNDIVLDIFGSYIIKWLHVFKSAVFLESLRISENHQNAFFF